jgi:dienelactone hydrolase
MEPQYQCVYIDLVKAGFVVLAYDPIGQGERRQYWNPETGQTDVAPDSIYEHTMPGQVLLLMGEDLTHYRIWDGMRAIDYLQSRPEVDAQRIACAGHSGGGTMTLFISALDERVKCAVVNEGGTSNRWPIHFGPGGGVGPSDVEQNYFPGAKYGVDMPDLHVAIAPRPLLALVEEYHPAFDRAAGEIRK